MANRRDAIGLDRVGFSHEVTWTIRTGSGMGLLSLEHSSFSYRADFALYGLAVTTLALLLVWHQPMAQAAASAGTVVLGAASWTLIEYGLHRVVLHHVQPFRRWHAAHHRAPRALIGLPTLISVGLFVVFVYAPAWALAGAWHASAFTLGVLVGYLGYAVVHHAVHHARSPGRWLRRRRRWHALHHRAGGEGTAFGVTSAVWDHAFHSTGANHAGR